MAHRKQGPLSPASKTFNSLYTIPSLAGPSVVESICTAMDAQNHAILVLKEQQGAARCGSDVADPHCAPLPSCGPSGKLLGCMLVTSRQASHMLFRSTAPRETTPGWSLMTPNPKVPREGNVKSQVKQKLPRSPPRVCSALPDFPCYFLTLLRIVYFKYPPSTMASLSGRPSRTFPEPLQSSHSNVLSAAAYR